MVLNDRSLTNQKNGLGNSLNLTNQDFYVRLVDEKTTKTIASLQAVPSPSGAHFDFRPSLSSAFHAGKSFRGSGAAVADDIYPGTKHNGTLVCSLYLLEKMESKINRSNIFWE